MALWSRLYLLIWLSFFEIIVILPPFYPSIPAEVHAVLGAVVLAVAVYNYAALKKTDAPGRLKRTAAASRSLAILLAILGIVLYANRIYSWGGILESALEFVHLGAALTVLSQASSVATGYDMWEEKEFQPQPPKTP